MMRVMALPDIHGRLNHLESVTEELREADLVLLPGDLTMFGRRAEVEAVVDPIKRVNARVLAVMGNCDYPEVESFLDENGFLLHRRHKALDGVVFVGLGGSLACPVPTLNEWTEEEIADHLAAAEKDAPNDMPLVLVSHQPPYGTAVDVVGGSRHVGSRAVRRFIEERQPLVCFSGHIHEAQGMDRIGNTQVVNPGPFLEGKYAVCDIAYGAAEIAIKQAKN